MNGCCDGDGPKVLKAEFCEMAAGLAGLRGGEAAVGLADALAQTRASVGVRPNRRKGAVVVAAGDEVEWATGRERRIAGERPRFTFDPALHQGLYYVQDPSSMAIGRVVASLTADGRSRVYVDACAAPGGKTTAAIDALPDGSVVVANEWDRRRAEVLRENVIKWGYGSVAVSRGDTSRFRKLRDFADIVAVDAPCSGEGMMRKDDDAVGQWSPQLVRECAALQREIVGNVWPALKPGGYLIYSTCTFNTAENEENVRWMIDELGAENVELPLPMVGGVAGGLGDTGVKAARFFPGRVDGEGLFMALLRKPLGAETDEPGQGGQKTRRQKGSDGRGKGVSLALVAKWLTDTEMSLKTDGDRVIAVPSAAAETIDRAAEALDLIYRGIEVATLKGRDYVPSQSLALSTMLDRKAFEEVEVDYQTAVAVLRGEAVRLENAPKGVVLLTYGGRPLSFAKNLGNRANNMYPKSWTIKSTHVPDKAPQVVE